MALIKKTVTVLLFVVLLAVATGTVSYAASSGSRSINNTYGKLNGTIGAGKIGGAKVFSVYSKVTKKAVPRIMAEVEVFVYSTGAHIGSDSSGWMTNTDRAGYDIYMDKFRSDGYGTTKCTAYGTHEAIIKNAYTVYTSTVY